MGASVRYRADRDAWCVFFRRAGKRWSQSFGPTARDEAEARAAAAAFEAEGEADREREASLYPGGPAPFESVAIAWWKSKEPTLPASSIASKRCVVYERLVPYFGALDVRRLDEDAASACAAHFAEQGHARETVETTGSILDSILAWAVRRGHATRCPVLRAHGGRGVRSIFRAVAAARCKPPARVESWTAAEVAILLECARLRGDWLADPILFAAQTGCRRGELIALEWADVDLVRARARLRQSKTRGQVKVTKADKVRSVELAPETTRMLAARAARWGRTGPVFRDRQGKPWEDYELSGHWIRMRRRAAVRGVRPLKLHCLRHTYASLALAAGHDVAWIAGQIGDTLEVFLRRYAHILPSSSRSLEFLSFSPAAGELPPGPCAPAATSPGAEPAQAPERRPRRVPRPGRNESTTRG